MFFIHFLFLVKELLLQKASVFRDGSFVSLALDEQRGRVASLKVTSPPKALADNDAGTGFICICLELALRFGV